MLNGRLSGYSGSPCFFGEYIAEMIADANFFGAKIKGLFGFPEGPLPITPVLYKIFAGVALLYA